MALNWADLDAEQEIRAGETPSVDFEIRDGATPPAIIPAANIVDVRATYFDFEAAHDIAAGIINGREGQQVILPGGGSGQSGWSYDESTGTITWVLELDDTLIGYATQASERKVIALKIEHNGGTFYVHVGLVQTNHRRVPIAG